MRQTAFKAWLLLVALTAMAADVAFRWPEGTVSAFAEVLFGYFLFIHACVLLTKLLDARAEARLRRSAEPALVRKTGA